MEVYDSLTEVMGNTPLHRLKSVTKGMAQDGQRARQDRVPEPGRLGQGPHRAADDRDRGTGGQAPQGRRDRRADLGQHGRRPGDRRAGARLPVRVHLPGQGGRRQDRGAARVRRRGGRVPDERAARPPGLLLQRRPPPRAGDAERLAARPVREPGQPGRALPLDRPGDLAADRRGGSPTSWRASAPAARSRAPAATSRRRRAGGCKVIGADPEGSVYSGGTGRPYLVEGVGEDIWPATFDRNDRRRGDRDQRRRLVRA